MNFFAVSKKVITDNFNRTSFFIIPYVKDVSEKLSTVLKKHNFKPIYFLAKISWIKLLEQEKIILN